MNIEHLKLRSYPRAIMAAFDPKNPANPVWLGHSVTVPLHKRWLAVHATINAVPNRDLVPSDVSWAARTLTDEATSYEPLPDADLTFYERLGSLRRLANDHGGWNGQFLERVARQILYLAYEGQREEYRDPGLHMAYGLAHLDLWQVRLPGYDLPPIARHLLEKWRHNQLAIPVSYLWHLAHIAQEFFLSREDLLYLVGYMVANLRIASWNHFTWYQVQRRELPVGVASLSQVTEAYLQILADERSVDPDAVAVIRRFRKSGTFTFRDPEVVKNGAKTQLQVALPEGEADLWVNPYEISQSGPVTYYRTDDKVCLAVDLEAVKTFVDATSLECPAMNYLEEE